MKTSFDEELADVRQRILEVQKEISELNGDVDHTYFLMGRATTLEEQENKLVKQADEERKLRIIMREEIENYLEGKTL